MNDFVQKPDNISHRTELSGVLLESVEDVLSEPIEEKDIAGALDRVRLFSRVRAHRRSLLSRRLLIGAAVAATLAIVVLFIWPDWHPVASVTWAEVVEAVAKKSWLHYTTTWHDGGKDEGWFSEKLAVNGSRFMPASHDYAQEYYTWIDYAKESQLYYYPETNSILRGSAQKTHWEHNKFFMTAMLSGNLGGANRSGRYEICDQQQQTITDDGKRYIEYRFHWRDIELDAQSSTQFVAYVDPDTHLPLRLGMIDQSSKKIMVHEQYDYPDSGPKDIYALGAPKTARIIDCSLSSEVEQLAKATVAAGCRENIQFSALIVRSTREEHWGYRVWKKGLLWRIESSVNPLVRRSDNLPPKDTDQAEWWKQKAEKVQFMPTALFNGKWHWIYSRETRHPNKAEIDAGMDKDVWIIVWTKKERLLPWLRDRYWQEVPLSNMGHPTTCDDLPPSGLPIYGEGGIGSPSPYYLTTIDPKPKHGPPNTILLELRNPIWKQAGSREENWGIPQTINFWIDPERDYLVMRREGIVTQEGMEEISGGSWIEKLTQNPQGRWFPTIIHNLVRYKEPDGNGLEDEILQFYYDFDATMPDSLFEP